MATGGADDARSGSDALVAPPANALVVAAQCLIAVRFPNFATVLSVIGCVCATVSIFFLPCLSRVPMSLRADGRLERPVATGPALAMMEGARTRAETARPRRDERQPPRGVARDGSRVVWFEEPTLHGSRVLPGHFGHDVLNNYAYVFNTLWEALVEVDSLDLVAAVQHGAYPRVAKLLESGQSPQDGELTNKQ